MKAKISEYHRGYVAWFSLVLVLGCVGIGYEGFVHFSWLTVGMTIVIFFLCHLSITCGLHRLYSHGSYEASDPLQYGLLSFAAATVEGDALFWVGKHRQHHACSDAEGDPHSPKDGKLHSHMLCWMSRVGATPSPSKYIRGLSTRYPLLKWQRKHYYKLAALFGFVLPAGIASLWGDPVGGFLLSFTRLIFQYNFTWVVNSAGHIARDGTIRPTNRPELAVLTVGESYHKNHHDFPNDYRLGREWYDLDPGKWLIWLCSQMGLASNLRRREATS